MKCPRCGKDSTPVLVHDQAVVPCGLISSYEMLPLGASIAGCPMTEWQDGYIAALRKHKASLDEKTKSRDTNPTKDGESK